MSERGHLGGQRALGIIPQLSPCSESSPGPGELLGAAAPSPALEASDLRTSKAFPGRVL